MAGGGVVGSSPGNACTMPNADTRAGFAVTDTLTPISSATLQEGGGVQDSAAATSRCIIINVRTNEADVAVKYDEGRQDMCRHRPPPSPATGLPGLSKQTGSCARSSICPATFDAFTQFFLPHYVYYCL